MGRLGNGGMDTVYAAVNPDGAYVALKPAHDDAPEEFDREFELMERVQGEYAVGVPAHRHLPGASLGGHRLPTGPQPAPAPAPGRTPPPNGTSPATAQTGQLR